MRVDQLIEPTFQAVDAAHAAASSDGAHELLPLLSAATDRSLGLLATVDLLIVARALALTSVNGKEGP